MIEIFVGLIIIWIFSDKTEKVSDKSEDTNPYMYDHFNNYDGHDGGDGE